MLNETRFNLVSAVNGGRCDTLDGFSPFLLTAVELRF
jgi:hypothetical protein